jgi:hypothetical protein
VARGYLAWYLFAFLLLYALAIVVWLARSGPAGTERSWKWRVVPAISLLFSILSLGLGAIANSGEMTIRQFSLVHVFPGASESFTTGLATALSPQTAAYDLFPNGSSAYLVQEDSADDNVPHTYVFDAKGDPSAQVALDLWATRSFTVAGFAGQGQFWIVRRPDSWLLANRSDSPLQRCTWIGSEGPVPLGDVPAHGELQLGLEMKKTQAGSNSDGSSAGRLLTRAIAQYQAESDTGAMGSCILCALESVSPSLSSFHAKLITRGSTGVVFHLGPPPLFGSEARPR